MQSHSRHFLKQCLFIYHVNIVVYNGIYTFHYHDFIESLAIIDMINEKAIANC